MPSPWIEACLAALLSAASGSVLAADFQRTTALGIELQALQQAVRWGESAGDILGAAAPLGIDVLAVPEVPFPPLAIGNVTAVAAPIELVLAQLALQTGANFHVALQQAQATPLVLMVQSGVADLPALKAAAIAAGLPDAIEETASGFIAHMPIAVWSEATLYVGKGQSLLLDRERGAFLVAAGTLSGEGGTIAGFGRPNPRLDTYNPFIITALSGQMRFAGMRFADLGMGEFTPLTGVTAVQGGFYHRGDAPIIRDSRFEHVGSLALVGTIGGGIARNIFVDSTGPAILLAGTRTTSLYNNIAIAGPAAHGIKITAGSSDAQLRDNLVAAAGLNGIFIDEGAANITLENNVVASSRRSGISVASADCISVTANLLISNAHSGLAIKDSAGLDIRDNRLFANGNAGISITDQPDYAAIAIATNALDGNQVGIRGSTTALLTLQNNDFSGQAPRLLDGELVQFSDRFFDLGQGGAPTIINGLQLKRTAPLTPSGAQRPTSCQFEGDA
jgi:poly(beta-D-mannuronate) C5 epimerase